MNIVFLVLANSSAQNGFTPINWTVLLEQTGKIVGVALSIITIISICIGLSFIHSLKNKQRSAAFSYWSQMKVRFVRIYHALTENPGLLNNLYRKEIRDTFEMGGPSTDEIKNFKSLIDDTEKFLRTASDQMPAYIGWNSDLGVIMKLFSDVSLYDIVNIDGMFVGDSFEKRNDYCKKVCDALNRVIDGIDNKQKEYEKKICKK